MSGCRVWLAALPARGLLAGTGCEDDDDGDPAADAAAALGTASGGVGFLPGAVAAWGIRG